MKSWSFAAIALACAFLVIPFAHPGLVRAQSVADLQAQIDANNAQITAINKEIAQYQTQLDATTEQKNTLQNKINQLNLQKQKLQSSISVTQKQINTTQLQITQLADGIATKQSNIVDDRAALAESLRTLYQAEKVPLSLEVLSSDNLAQAWQDVDNLATLQTSVQSDIKELNDETQSLTESKESAEQKKADLLKQQQTLSTQQGSLAATLSSQATLLAQTKSQESTYQTLLKQKQAQEASFEDALNDLKSQMNVAVNPTDITAPKAGVLQWPLTGKITITQFFGDTPFSQTNPGLYRGNGHDGLDIAAPIGTPVHAALSGTILGTGNTDATKGCYSFGKWVMIKHNNGINTMYAHLSEIDVTAGQAVATGDIIGYSGETGYATGPHLHFGVYVTAVTKIIALGVATNSSTPCSKALMPVPPVSGYLNPLNYLPATAYKVLD